VIQRQQLPAALNRAAVVISVSRATADWFCPQAEVVHLGGVSVRQVPYRWVLLSHLGMYRYFYFGPRISAAARPLAAAAIGLRAAAKLAGAAVDARLYDRAH